MTALGIVCAVAQLMAIAAWSEISPPDTPAGRVLATWLDTFNSGDLARMDAYYKQYEPTAPMERESNFRKRTGGFELLEIVSSEESVVQFRVKERASDTVGVGILELTPADGKQKVRRVLRVVAPGAAIIGFKIDAQTRKRVIEGAAAKLKESYVFPEISTKMEQALREREKRGEYDAVMNGDAFAALLTAHLQEVSHDKHLRVTFSPARSKDPLVQLTSDEIARNRKEIARLNCGFEKAERLAGNVGYVKINMFANPDVCGPTAIAAMNFVGNAEALIFDLRDNGGGDPKMIALLSTYLFDGPIHLNDIWERKTDSTQQYWTLPYVPGRRLTIEPIYVLTSQRTFSGAEEFSYNLKNLKRATIVGEITGGGAHPVRNEQVDDRFLIGVPFARAINPLTKTNWEGTGVEPDVKTSAANALSTAQQLAGQKLAGE